VAQTEKTGDGVRAVERALDILLAFDAADQELSAGELLKRVDLSRPTLYRLLQTLEQKDFIVSTGNPQRFGLGSALARLAHYWTARTDLVAAAEPMMRKLRDETEETVSLLVLRAGQRVCAAELPSPQPLSFRRGVGFSESIDRGASGRAILAFVADPEPYLTPELSTAKRQEFLAELAKVKRNGYATSENEMIRGASAVAVPFFGRDGSPAGALAVFGPTVRMDKDRVKSIAKLLQEQAHALTRVLGGA
jgi:DNA-binding IclR family transcriptional regulator